MVNKTNPLTQTPGLGFKTFTKLKGLAKPAAYFLVPAQV